MMTFSSLSITLALASTIASAAAAGRPSSSLPKPLPKATYAKTSFIPPAAPTLVSPLKPVKASTGWPSAVNHPSRAQQQIANGYGTYSYHVASTSALHAKKKKGGGADTAPKKAKIQVMILQTVPNIGQAGDIVSVSSAVFQNQLQKTKKARLISEEEIAKLEQEKEKEEQVHVEMAKKTKAMIEEAMFENLGGEDQCEDNGADICGVALEMKRKAGPEGNLFGGVNPKMVMEALESQYPKGSWDGKQVKLTEVKDTNGEDVKKKDIKHIGEYTMSVALWKGVDVTFILSITAE